MAIRTHAHTDHTTACTIRSGYATYAGARRWVNTHAAPSGHCYGVVTTPGTPAWAETYDVVCDTIDGQSDGAPTVPATDTPTFDDDNTDAPTDTYAPCVCGAPSHPLDTIADGTHVTIHMHRGNGTGAVITRTVAGTTSTTMTDDGYTYTTITLDDGSGTWTTPRTDYVAHTDADMADAPTDTAIVFGRPVPTHVAHTMGAIDPATGDTYTYAPTADDGMIPGRTYTGTCRVVRYVDGVRSMADTYTAYTDGTITYRTYAYDDGSTVTTYAWR